MGTNNTFQKSALDAVTLTEQVFTADDGGVLEFNQNNVWTGKSIYYKARDNKIGTRSVLKPAPIFINPLTMAQKPLFI